MNMNEQFNLAEEFLNEMATDRFSNDKLFAAFKKAYPNAPRNGTDEEFYGNSRETLISKIFEAVRPYKKFQDAEVIHRDDENQLLSVALTIIYSTEFVPIKGQVAPTTSATNREEVVLNDVAENKWPSYQEFRQKWYAKTVSKGWPKDVLPQIKEPMKIAGMVLPWAKRDHTAFAFTKNGMGRVNIFTNYTKKIKDALYARFEHDLTGLRELSTLVNSIVETEKTFFKGRLLSNIAGFLIKQAFKGMGASDVVDNAFVKFMLSKIKGMTIFQYQQMILDEMVMKMNLDDTTVSDLRNILFPIRIIVGKKLPLYEPTKITAEMRQGTAKVRGGYICSFKILSKKKDTSVFSGEAYYDMLKNVVLPISKGELVNKSFDDGPTKEAVEKNMVILQDKKTQKPPATEKEIYNSLSEMLFTIAREKDGEPDGEFQLNFKFLAHSAKVEVIYIPNKKDKP